MYKKKIARLALCTALCALVTTSVFAPPARQSGAADGQGAGWIYT